MKSRKSYAILFGTMALLYVLCIAFLWWFGAKRIQSQMITETEAAAEQAVDRMERAAQSFPDDCTESELAYLLQTAMVDSSDGKSGSYAYRSVSVLERNQILARSRNALLVDVVWENGTEEKIPMTFEDENSVDVAQFLLNAGNLDGRYCPVIFNGYWQDDWFYIQTVQPTDTLVYDYEAPSSKVPEGAKQETIQIKCPLTLSPGESSRETGEVNAKSMTVTTVMKSYEGDDPYASYVLDWKLDDAVMEEYQLFRRDDGTQPDVCDYRIFHTAVFQTVTLSPFGPERQGNYRFVYLAEFSPLKLSMLALLKDGTVFAFLLMFAAAGIFQGTSWSYRRNTELRSYRDEITRQKQALDYAGNAEKSRREMTSAIAHELKTPISVLSSYAEAVQENIDAEKQSHYLAVIREETARMDRMVLELLDLSRLEAGKYRLQRENFDLSELAREIITPLGPQIAEKNLTVEYQIGNPMVNADRGRMGQIVENFMTNAIRHTPDGGKIVLRIGTEQETLSVENQGRCIPQENLKKVWEMFWQGDASRSERGTGLGLPICRSIVELHGGSCKAENTAAGVRFSVSLTPEKRLYQLGRMPQETTIELEFPIASPDTTVENVLERLGLCAGKALRQELNAGNIRVGAEIIRERKTKLYPNYVLSWKEYRITVRLDDDNKRRALLMERMRSGGLGNPDSGKAMGYTPAK